MRPQLKTQRTTPSPTPSGRYRYSCLFHVRPDVRLLAWSCFKKISTWLAIDKTQLTSSQTKTATRIYNPLIINRRLKGFAVTILGSVKLATLKSDEIIKAEVSSLHVSGMYVMSLPLCVKNCKALHTRRRAI